MNVTKLNYEKLNTLLNTNVYEAKHIIGAAKQTLEKWQHFSLIKLTDKFSLIDILWIGILVEFKSYNVGVDTVIKVKDFLFSDINDNKTTNLKNIDWATIQVLAKARPIFLVTNLKGDFYLLDDLSYFKKLQSGIITNHVILSLNKLINLNIETLFTKPDFNAFGGLSKDEIEVLLILRSENYLSVTITKKNGVIDAIEGTEKVSQKDRIVNILKQHDYQDIEIKQARGKIVHIKRTIKKRLADK